MVVVLVLSIVFIISWQVVFCEEGYLGYEGGILFYKDLDLKKIKIEYYEYIFVIGKFILFLGIIDVKIKRVVNNEIFFYIYDFKDLMGKLVIKRIVSLKGSLIKFLNGSIIKEYIFVSYKEILIVDSVIYNFQSYLFLKFIVVDLNLVVNFF